MEWARKSKKPVVFLKIDFAKAYDWIEWPFILAMLQAIGFGTNFLQSMEMVMLALPSISPNLMPLSFSIPSGFFFV